MTDAPFNPGPDSTSNNVIFAPTSANAFAQAKPANPPPTIATEGLSEELYSLFVWWVLKQQQWSRTQGREDIKEPTIEECSAFNLVYISIMFNIKAKTAIASAKISFLPSWRNQKYGLKEGWKFDKKNRI